jgi:hypothetical protein
MTTEQKAHTVERALPGEDCWHVLHPDGVWIRDVVWGHDAAVRQAEARTAEDAEA